MNRFFLILVVSALNFFQAALPLAAQEESQHEEKQKSPRGIIPIDIKGDQIEFFAQGNKAIASGNVSIVKENTKLTCDKVEFSKDTGIAIAEGNVILSTPQGRIYGDKLIFNFEKMIGELAGAKLVSPPYYAESRSLTKIDDDKITMARGYVTTCDLDKPHYRFKSKSIDVYPGEIGGPQCPDGHRKSADFIHSQIYTSYQ